MINRTILLFLVGAGTGATVALLTAPMSGRETRRKLKQVTGELADRASRVAPAFQEAYRMATVAGKEAFVQTLNGPAMKSSDVVGALHH